MTSNATLCDRAVVDRVYRVADELDRDYAGLGLDVAFAGRMVDAVLRCFARCGLRARDGRRRDLHERVEFAEALLRRIWRRNARRDLARLAAARDRGVVPRVVVPLDLAATAVSEPAPTAGDLFAGDSGRLVAACLQEHGWPANRAWAFVLREAGYDWDDVAFLVGRLCGSSPGPPTLRQWSVRHFAEARRMARSFLLPEGPGRIHIFRNLVGWILRPVSAWRAA
ncbi:MAG: hypothetical protein ACLQVD_03695 [Capsulimonadaceae bacterium]